MLRAIADAGLPPTRSLATAPAAIAIAMPRGKGASGLSQAYDEGRAAERILVAATLLGLGAGIAWVRSEVGQPMAELLGLPDDRYIRTIVAIGHPTDAAQRPKAAPGRRAFRAADRLPRALAVLSVPRGRESDPVSGSAARRLRTRVNDLHEADVLLARVPRVVGAARARAGRIVVDDDRPTAPLPRPAHRSPIATRSPAIVRALGRLAVRRRPLVGAVRPVPTGPRPAAGPPAAGGPPSATSAIAAAVAMTRLGGRAIATAATTIPIAGITPAAVSPTVRCTSSVTELRDRPRAARISPSATQAPMRSSHDGMPAHRGRRSRPTASATSTPIVRTGMPTSRQALRKTCTMRYPRRAPRVRGRSRGSRTRGRRWPAGDGHDDEPATPRHRHHVEEVLERRRRILGRAGVERTGLHHRATRRGEPVEALGWRHPGERPGGHRSPPRPR